MPLEDNNRPCSFAETFLPSGAILTVSEDPQSRLFRSLLNYASHPHDIGDHANKLRAFALIAVLLCSDDISISVHLHK